MTLVKNTVIPLDTGEEVTIFANYIVGSYNQIVLGCDASQSEIINNSKLLIRRK